MANQEAFQTAFQLAVAYVQAVRDRDTLALVVNKPICGKPGRGYKAAKRLRPLLVSAERAVKDVLAERDTWARSGKANFKRRQARLDLFAECLIGFDNGNPVAPTDFSA